jgi:eukaryotic-like serine/threonine-protein kinase
MAVDSTQQADGWKHLDQALSEILAAPADKREALMQARLGQSPELLAIARQVLDDEQAMPRLVDLAADLLGDLGQSLATKSHQGLIGQSLGPYEIIAEIGRGGMGSVFLARRTDGAFEREVAIKLLPWSQRGGDLVERVMRERGLLARLNHPGIARLIDGGSAPDGSPYLVLEYVPGLPITDYCDTRALDLDRRLQLFKQVLEVVQYAHRNLIVHRDLKPANIMVTDEGQIKLLDFGIAKLIDTREPTELTRQFGQRLTPDYAAPELFGSGEITTATDVYALGCLLYRLIAGQVPLHLAERSLTEIILQLARPQRPAMSRLAKDTMPPGIRVGAISVDLDAIAKRAVAADAATRYGSVTELVEEFKRLENGLPVLARSGGSLYQASRFIRRHRHGLGLATTAFLILGLFALTALWQAEQAREQRDEAVAVAELLRELLHLADPNLVAGQVINAQHMLHAALERASSDEAIGDTTRIRLLTDLAEALQAHDQISEAVQARRLIHDLTLSRFGVDHPESLTSLRRLAMARRELGQGIGELEAVFRELLDRRRAVMGETHLDTAQSYWDLGFLYLRYSEPNHPGRSQSAELIEHALSIHLDRLGPEHLTSSANLFDLGLATDKPELQIERMREAIAVRQRLTVNGDVLLASQLGDLALVLDRNKQAEQAIVVGREALQLHQHLMGEMHPISIRLLNNLAGIHRDHGWLNEALSLYQRSDELIRAVTPENHRRRAFPQYGIGATLVGLGRHAEAEGYLRQADRILSLYDDRQRLATTRARLGDCLAGQGRVMEADSAYRQALELYRQMGHDEEHADIVRLHHALAEISRPVTPGSL